MRTELFIDGGSVATSNRFPVTTPATEEVVHHIPAGSAADAAVRAARAAFDSGPWPKIRAPSAPATCTRSRKPSATACPTSRREAIDNGKPLPEDEWDLADAAGCFDFYADARLEAGAGSGGPAQPGCSAAGLIDNRLLPIEEISLFHARGIAGRIRRCGKLSSQAGRMSAMRNGGQLLVESLVALGARKGFGVPGESYLAVLDALHDCQGKLDFVLCRNEGGAAFMAAAWGKLTGEPGVCFVTRGPGVTNASIGVHTAMQDSVPMLLFVGQVGTDMKGREAFQEIDYRAVFGTMAKWAVEIDDVDRLTEILARAWTTATTGRPGPVVVALPEDMLTGQTSAAPLTGPTKVTEPAPTPEAVDAALALVDKAVRPLVLIEGANWTENGKKALQAFGERSDIPVIAAFRFQDQFDNFSPVFCGEAGVGMPPHVKRLIRDADVILAINTRFGEMTTDGYTLLAVPCPKQTLIHVHASDREIGKVYQPALGIHAGPNAFAAALRPVQGGWADWRAEGRAAWEASFEAPVQPSPVDMVAVTAHLRKVLPENVIVTNGAGNFTVWPNKFFKFGPRARLLAPQSGAMGYGLPAAVAAKVACPDSVVLCFAGDGDFQMNCQELGTAMQAGAQPIVLILNNGIYGTIRAHQERTYPGRVSGTTMENPDFTMLARAYGYHAERVARTEDFPAAFDRALASRTGAVLDLDISPEALTPRQTLSEMRAAALKTMAGT